MIGGVPREHITETRLHTDAHQRQQPCGLPLFGGRELLISQHDAGQLVGLVRMTMRQTHRHVEVGHPCRETAVEHTHDEAGIDRVERVGDSVFSAQRGYIVGAGGVDPGRTESGISETVHHRLSSRDVVIRDHQGLEEIPPRRDEGGRTTHSPAPTISIRMAITGPRLR